MQALRVTKEFVLLDNDVILPVVTIFDEFGDETNIWEDAYVVIAGQDDYWVNIRLDPGTDVNN